MPLFRKSWLTNHNHRVACCCVTGAPVWQLGTLAAPSGFSRCFKVAILKIKNIYRNMQDFGFPWNLVYVVTLGQHSCMTPVSAFWLLLYDQIMWFSSFIPFWLFLIYVTHQWTFEGAKPASGFQLELEKQVDFSKPLKIQVPKLFLPFCFPMQINQKELDSSRSVTALLNWVVSTQARKCGCGLWDQDYDTIAWINA